MPRRRRAAGPLLVVALAAGALAAPPGAEVGAAVVPPLQTTADLDLAVRPVSVPDVGDLVVGDWDGDGRDDVIVHQSGTAPDWRLTSTGADLVTTDLSMVGNYRLYPLDHDGDGDDDLLLYAPGPYADRILSFGSGTGATFDVDSIRFKPTVGDFDGDGDDDVWWYRPGLGSDPRWLSNGDGTFASSDWDVDFVYKRLAADLTGDGTTDVWLRGFAGLADRLVTFGEALGGTFSTSDDPVLLTGDFDGDGIDDLLWYGPGAEPDELWYANADGTFQEEPVAIDVDAEPHVGDLDGDGRDDLLLYGPGAASDEIRWGSATRGSFPAQARDLSGDYDLALLDVDGDDADDLLLRDPAGQDWLARAVDQVIVGTTDVLPYSLTYASRGDASVACLQDPPSGMSPDLVCPGPNRGTFGVLDIVRPFDMGEGAGCSNTTSQARFARNVALGLDHELAPRRDLDANGVLGAGDEGQRLDECTPVQLSPNAVWANSRPNDKSATEAALLAGGAFGPGRLTVVPLLADAGRPWHTALFDPKGNGGWTIDDMGLWDFIGTASETFGGDWIEWEQVTQGEPGVGHEDHPANGIPDYAWDLGGSSLPGLCDPDTDPYVEPHRDDDWNPLTPSSDDDGIVGVEDPRRTWWWNRDRMIHCLYAIDQSASDTTVFDRDSDGDGTYDLEHSPRFGYLPEAWQDLDALLAGSGPWDIRRFRPAYLDLIFYISGGSNVCASIAGEGQVTVSGTCPRGSNVFRSTHALLFDVDDINTGGATMLPPELQPPWVPPSGRWVPVP